MDISEIATTLAIPLGVAVTVLVQVVKLLGVKDKNIIRLMVLGLSVVLAVLLTYASSAYEVVQTAIFTAGSAVLAYEMAVKPILNE